MTLTDSLSYTHVCTHTHTHTHTHWQTWPKDRLTCNQKGKQCKSVARTHINQLSDKHFVQLPTSSNTAVDPSKGKYLAGWQNKYHVTIPLPYKLERKNPGHFMPKFVNFMALHDWPMPKFVNLVALHDWPMPKICELHGTTWLTYARICELNGTSWLAYARICDDWPSFFFFSAATGARVCWPSSRKGAGGARYFSDHVSAPSVVSWGKPLWKQHSAECM